MLSGNLKFYHGTTLSSLEKIKSEGVIKPNEIKHIGKYWITKGVYFVCENPYYALWYAKFACFLDYNRKKKKNVNLTAVEEIPVVLEIDNLLNLPCVKVHLLTSGGMRILLNEHKRFLDHYEKNRRSYGKHDNLDAYALMRLKNMFPTESVCVFAAFQEGESVQRVMLDKEYTEEYIQERKCFCVGDNLSACFLDWVKLDNLGHYNILSENDVLRMNSESGAVSVFEKMCDGLNCQLCNMEYYPDLLCYYNGELK